MAIRAGAAHNNCSRTEGTPLGTANDTLKIGPLTLKICEPGPKRRSQTISRGGGEKGLLMPGDALGSHFSLK